MTKPESDKLEPVKAWGIINYGGGLMNIAFTSKAKAKIDLLSRWPNAGGECRVIPVTITITHEGE